MFQKVQEKKYLNLLSTETNPENSKAAVGRSSAS